MLARLHALHQREIEDFKQRLEAALTRRVAAIRLTVLRGHSVECGDIESAIAYLIEEEKMASTGRRLRFKFDSTRVRGLKLLSPSAARPLRFSMALPEQLYEVLDALGFQRKDETWVAAQKLRPTIEPPFKLHAAGSRCLQTGCPDTS
ncbi:MAG: hypothetical protein NT154_42355 [Verrucomicrobia bacterium]|nr:hypothetical protein [Verrucomicrobiota bacterium]